MAAVRIVVVSTFPPRRDGIARYADQLAQKTAETNPVFRIGLPGSTADEVVNLNGYLRPLRLVTRTRPGDQLLVMWHPEFFVTGSTRSRLLAYLALGAALRLRRAHVVVHEPDSAPSPPGGPVRRMVAALETLVRRWTWASPAEMLFHSEGERRDFATRYPSTWRPGKSRLVAHGRGFRAATTVARPDARARLGLGAGGVVFVCLGFIAQHKGFDRAIRAFAQLPPGSARLYVIGSSLYNSREEEAYLAELQELAGTVAGVEVRAGYIDDETFDLWVRAADAVVLPYRSIASSSVAARANLLEVPVIAARVGALPEQLGPQDALFDDDIELSRLMRAVVEPA
ncbi:MAG: D-inositol-3-phosphate glycosyltransferase [Chloroflexota bacterium]|nr:D-inositol-3-phosphate glycosyltransferase [Chloroflexota bacterium]